MSIHPDMERWKRRFLTCVFLAAGMLLFMGAVEIRDAVHGHPARLDKASEAQREWTRALGHEFDGNGSEWDQLAEDRPELLLRASTSAPTTGVVR